MPNLQLDWQQGAALAAVLAASAVLACRTGTRRSARLAPYLREAAIIAALYSLWQLAAAVSVFGTHGAFDRAHWLVRVQRRLGLPDEQTMQGLIIHHPLIEQACNLYYASMHFGALGIFLAWLFIRHRDRYPMVRAVLILLTAICLLVQLIPVAPPRLLPDLGFVDTAARYGQSVYQISGITVDSLSAMPSVHVGWALLVAWAVISVSTSRYRWWVLAHPIVTVFVVVATANHFWADGIVAALLLVLSILVVQAGYRVIRRSSVLVSEQIVEPAYR
ncbi:MAG TPA: phosphatase PAP2 family protein [Jatrophihabitans sp.]|jgi:hypothetical protein